jgi:glycerol-3-phosphate dehydrogenase
MFGFKRKAKPDLGNVRILKHAKAHRVVFFYPGEEGTYIDGATVTIFENGIVHIRAEKEETTTHLSHCEVLWRYTSSTRHERHDNVVPLK